MSDDVTCNPVTHNHSAFLSKASKRPGFQIAYDSLETKYALVHQMLAARKRAGLTQEAVADHMGTTKSAVSRLEAAGKHSPSIASLQKYAEAVGCSLKIEFISHSSVKSPKIDASLGNSKKQGAGGKKVKPSAPITSKSSQKTFS